MQVNNKTVKSTRNIVLVLQAILFFIVGAALVGFGIYFLISPLPDEEGKKSSLPGLILIGFGIGCILVAISATRRVLRAKRIAKPLSEEEVQANEERLNINAPDIPNVTDTQLYFHFGGKLNQSFFAEDRTGKTVYECRLKKFNPVGANVFEFTDLENDYTKTVKIGKTTTMTSSSGSYMFGANVSSNFNIDGVSCWEYMHQRGYEIKQFMFERDFLRFELCKLDTKVADIFPADFKDPWNENTNLLHMVKGCFRLEIIDGKLEDVIMAAFIIYQTEIVE